MELKVDEKTEMIIVSSGESVNEIEVKLLNNKGKIVSEHVFIHNALTDYYYGNIKFPERGTWTLVIDGEKSKPFKN